MNLRLPYPNIISSVPDFLMGLAFLVTWIEPTAIGEDMVPYLFQVMMVEFIIIHSAGFMGTVIYGNEPRAKKVKVPCSDFILFYFLFILGNVLRIPLVVAGDRVRRIDVQQNDECLHRTGRSREKRMSSSRICGRSTSSVTLFPSLRRSFFRCRNWGSRRINSPI
jgi:hypothetical protein